MKKMYSLILLFSFFIGMMQPILPMIEFQLFQGGVKALLHSEEGVSDVPVERVLFSLNTTSENQNKDSDSGVLLDDDYYPLGIQNASVPEPYNFAHRAKLYLPVLKNINNIAYLPNPPPPRLS